MDDPPTWLNEGLAEYVEIAERRGGRFTGEGIHTSHLQTLKRSQRPKLAELVSLSREAFYQNSQLHYAQSWAFVHFLRHSSRQHRGGEGGDGGQA